MRTVAVVPGSQTWAQLLELRKERYVLESVAETELDGASFHAAVYEDGGEEMTLCGMASHGSMVSLSVLAHVSDPSVFSRYETCELWRFASKECRAKTAVEKARSIGSDFLSVLGRLLFQMHTQGLAVRWALAGCRKEDVRVYNCHAGTNFLAVGDPWIHTTTRGVEIELIPYALKIVDLLACLRAKKTPERYKALLREAPYLVEL